MRSVWGLGTALEPARARDTLRKWRAAGFSAVEGGLDELAPLAELLRELDFAAIPSAWSSWPQYDGAWEDRPVAAHVAALARDVERAAAFAAASRVRVLKVNAHSGCDSWSTAQCVEYFGAVGGLGRAAGLALCHETHRGRALHSAHRTGRVLARCPELRLTADVSHFFVVHERLVGAHGGREAALMARVAARADHVHARVGSAQAPQLADARDGGAWRAPGGADAVAARAAHASFWRSVWAARAADGAAETTATIELGPPPYTQVDLDGAPLVPLERAVDDAAAWLRDEFDAWHRESTSSRL